MSFIELKNISKCYSLSKKESFYALKDISISLPRNGFISILGKSGSGKSTLLNILGRLDKPSSGTFLFNSKNINNLSRKEKKLFYKEYVGFIFQQYHLIEDQTVLYNVMLPMLINGKSIEQSKTEAKELLTKLGFDEELINKKVFDISGGEKQRTAIVRALINSPKLLLCDEPTGALDSKNGIEVMELLKRASKYRLVIMVSHNKEFVQEYSDRIITLKDGKLVNDETLHEIKEIAPPIVNQPSLRSKITWIDQLAKSNIKRRKKKNIVSIISLSFSLVSSILIFGFSSSSNSAISNYMKKRLDYGSSLVSKEQTNRVEGTAISLIKQTRPAQKEMDNCLKNFENLKYFNNYDTLFSGLTIAYKDESFDTILYKPVYRFNTDYIDKNLIIEGTISNDSINQIIINKQCYELLLKYNDFSISKSEINISSNCLSSYMTYDSENTILRDTFSLSINCKIQAVVDEANFLTEPTIYYSYYSLDKYLSTYLLNNMSDYFHEDISWKYRISTVSSNDELSSYSYRLFINDINQVSDLKKTFEEGGLSLSNNGLLIENSLVDLISASTIGMEAFLVIAILGTVLIMGIISYSSYSEDIHRSAVLSSLGAKREEIISLYLYENTYVGLLALGISLILSPILIIGINYIVKTFTGINKIIAFPWTWLLSFEGSFIFLLVVFTLFIILLATVVPILVGKRISIVEELQS